MDQDALQKVAAVTSQLEQAQQRMLHLEEEIKRVDTQMADITAAIEASNTMEELRARIRGM